MEESSSLRPMRAARWALLELGGILQEANGPADRYSADARHYAYSYGTGR